MRLHLGILVCFLTASLVEAQSDSTSHIRKNVVSVELGGGSFRFFRYGNPFNLGYHRIVYFKSNEYVQLEFRLGASYFKADSYTTQTVKAVVLFPGEVDVLIGFKSFKVEIGLGYTPIFGEQSYLAYDSKGDLFNYQTRYYHFVTGRLGFCFTPVRVFPIFIRATWTPAYVLQPSAIPRYQSRNNRVWASLTLGYSF